MEYNYFVDLGSWFFIAYMVGTIASATLSSVLDWLNSEKDSIKEQVSRLHSLGALAKKLFTSRKINKAIEYKSASDRFDGMVNDVTSGFHTAILVFGVVPLVVATVHSMFPSLRMVWCWILGYGAVKYASSIAEIPFSYIRNFKVEGRFGFNKTTTKTFIKDTILGFGISIPMFVGITLFVDWGLRKYGSSSTGLILTMLGIGFIIVECVQWLTINVFMPLFNKFTPLKDKSLSAKIRTLCRKCGINVSKILVMDASKRSTHSNAFICSSLGKKRIVVFDTLLKKLSPDEVLAVLAHEIGHGKLHHLLYSRIVSAVVYTIFAVAAVSLLKSTAFYHAFGFNWVTEGNISENYIAGLWLAGMFISAFTWVFEFVHNLVSRKMELAADAYAVSVLGKKRKSMEEALMKISSDNLSDTAPHPLYEFFYYSHPSLVNRVEAIRKH